MVELTLKSMAVNLGRPAIIGLTGEYKMKRILALGAAIAVPCAAFAQTPVSPMPAAPAPIVAIQPISNGNAVLRTGTPVVLKLDEELTTKDKKLKLNQHFQMEVAEGVVVEGVVVIPAGTPAVGEITDVRNKGMWGKSGRFAGQVLYLTVNGRQIRMNGVFDSKGTAGGIGAVAVSAIVFAPAGFFISGTNAKLPIGTPLKGFVGEDVQLAFASQSAAPLQVAAPAPMAVAAAPVATPGAGEVPAK